MLKNKYDDSIYTVAFCGLPSSGKSTMINSLIGERILQSGVCRTTTEMTELSEKIICSDDGCKFISIDLPGICDSEEKDTKFNDMTYDTIKRANLICFVSDVNKAFITTHERDEYFKIKKILQDLEADSGKIYNICIFLTKCDFCEHRPKESKKPPPKKSKKKYEELSDDEGEDTDLTDLVMGVREKMKNEDIYLFNAYGRIEHIDKLTKNKKKISAKLKKIVKGGAKEYNIEFNIKKYYENYDKKQEISYRDKYKYYFESFLNNGTKIDKIIESFENLTEIDKFDNIKVYLENTNNYKYFQLVHTITTLHPLYYNWNERNMQNEFAYFFFQCYVNILNDSQFSMSQNLTLELDVKLCWDNIQKYFEDIADKTKYDIMVNEVIFKNGLFYQNHAHHTTFIQKCFLQPGGFIKYNFEENFNDFISKCCSVEFNSFYTKMINAWRPICLQIPENITKEPTHYQYTCDCPNDIKMKKNEVVVGDYWYSNKKHDWCTLCDNTYCTEQKSTMIDYSKMMAEIDIYLQQFEEHIFDPSYILYNKLQLLQYIFNTPPERMGRTMHDHHFLRYDVENIAGQTKYQCIVSKIINHSKYIKLVKKFYRTLINMSKDIINIKELNVVSIDELLYKIDNQNDNLLASSNNESLNSSNSDDE